MTRRWIPWTLGAVVAALVLVVIRVGVALVVTRPPAEPPVAMHGGDVYGDPLPEGAVARLGTIRFRGRGPAVWAPDGEHLLVGGWTDEILAMNATTGLVDLTLPGHSTPFTRDVDDLESLWRVIRRGEMPLEDDMLSGLTMFPDGRRLLSQGYSLRIWDLPTRTELKVIPLRGGNVCDARISTDGTHCAFAWIDCVRIVDLVAGRERRSNRVGRFEGKDQNQVECVAWSGDGARVFAGMQDGRVAVVSIERATPVYFPVSDCAIDAVLVADEGRALWTLDHKGVLTIRSLASPSVAPRRIELGAVGDPKSHSWRGTLVASADGRVVATCDGLATRTFDAATGALVENATAGGVAWPIGWSPGGTRYAEWTGGWIRVVGDGAPTRPETVAGRQSAAAWSPDGRFVATASRYFGTHCVSVWNAATGREIWTRRYEEPDLFSSIAWTADGAGVRVSAHKRIVEFDAATGAERWTHAVGSDNQANWPRMDPRGESAVWVDEERDLHFVDLRGERREVGVAHLATKPNQDGPLFAVLPALAGAVLLECVPTKVADDGQSWSGQWRVRRWRVGGAAPEASIDAIGTAVFSATGDGRFAAAGNSQIAVYDLASVPPREIGRTDVQARRRGDALQASAVALSPDASLLAVGDGEGTVRLWSVPGCVLVKTLRGHRGKIECLAFSDDGARLVSGSVDATALVWRLR